MIRPQDIKYDTIYDMTFPTGGPVRCRRIPRDQQLTPESLYFKCYQQFDLVDSGVFTDVFYFPDFVCQYIDVVEVKGDVQQYLDKGVEMVFSQKGKDRDAEMIARMKQ
jgi:hypothetical protein